MSPANAAIIDEAYISPIKSILFIDDKFPTHADLLKKSLTTDTEEEHIEANLRDIATENQFDHEEDNTHNGNIDIEEIQEEHDRSIDEHVLRLTQSCRENGYIFDVENNLECIERDEYAFINKSDLVVLDYFLTEGEDSSHALKIIHSLAQSKRYNLIIVHSTKEKQDVASEILFSMKNITYENTEREELANAAAIEAIVNENIRHILDGSEEHIKTICSLAGSASKEKVIYFTNQIISNNFRSTTKSKSDLVLQSDIASSTTPWIAAKNAFIVVTQKDIASEQDINNLIQELKTALTEYDPGIITKALHKFANISKENIYEILNSSFSTPEIRAAALLTALNGISSIETHPHKANIIANRITHAILSAASTGIASKADQFCINYIDSLQIENEATIHRACTTAENANCTMDKIFLHANAMACCEQKPHHYITTGSIFTQEDKSWMCVTPSCDLARGEDFNASKIIFIEAIKLTKITDSNRIAKALKDAHKGLYIFVKTTTGVDVYSPYNDSKPNLHIDNFFIRGTTFLTIDDTIRLYTVEADEVGYSVMSQQSNVIAQLRPDYASRFLSEKGAWKSRIGVDFFQYKPE